MTALFLLGSSAFLLCLILTPVCRDFFLNRGWVDQPDGGRKFHLRAVPRIGGIPIALSFGGALVFVLLLNPMKGKLYIQHEHVFLGLIPAATLMFATGLYDDLKGLKPLQKLLGQLLASVFAVWFGARLALLPTHPSVSFLLSVVWLIACTNAVNLIDGMDGLATGVGLLATLTTLMVALLGGNMGLALATVPLAGCLIAFLRYNFSPASVFLGDCGSLSIGFVLGCFGLIWSQRAGTLLGMLAPLMALALPLLDVCVAILRRFLRRVSIFQADRGHIHHMVLGLGFSTRRAALLLYGFCGLSAFLAIIASVSPGGVHWAILCTFCGMVLFCINRLGYVEFSAARRMLSGSSMLKAIQDEIYLQELEVLLAQAESLDAWWSIVCEACCELNFVSAKIDAEGRSFYQEFIASSSGPHCNIQLDLGQQTCVSLSRTGEACTPRIVMNVVYRLQTSLQQRPELLQPQAVSASAQNAA